MNLLLILIVICTPAAASQTGCSSSCYPKLPPDLLPWCLPVNAAAALAIQVRAIKKEFSDNAEHLHGRLAPVVLLQLTSAELSYLPLVRCCCLRRVAWLASILRIKDSYSEALHHIRCTGALGQLSRLARCQYDFRQIPPKGQYSSPARTLGGPGSL